MNSKATLYEELELISTKPNRLGLNEKVISGLKKILQVINDCLSQGSEPRIYLVRTIDGEIKYNAFDPANDIAIYGASEDMLRGWLEQRRCSQSRSWLYLIR